jgi:hypothetical protein
MARGAELGVSTSVRKRWILNMRQTSFLTHLRCKITRSFMALAKTSRPTLAATLARPRLFRRLDRARQRPVTRVWDRSES